MNGDTIALLTVFGSLGVISLPLLIYIVRVWWGLCVISWKENIF